MSKKFRLDKYNKDRTKSYEFSKQHGTPFDDTDVKKKHHTIVINRLGALFSDDQKIKQSSACSKLSKADVCTIAPFKRTKSECKVCVGNY